MGDFPFTHGQSPWNSALRVIRRENPFPMLSVRKVAHHLGALVALPEEVLVPPAPSALVIEPLIYRVPL